MSNKHMRWWWVAAAIAGGGIWWYFSRTKTAKPVSKPPAAPAPGSNSPAPDATVDVSKSPAPGSGTTGSNLYSLNGTVITSSPETTNWWIGSNVVQLVTTRDAFLGIMLDSTVDSNGDADATGNIYTWYKILPSADMGFPGGGQYWVREDQVTIK